MNYQKHCCVIYASWEHGHYSRRTISGLAGEASIVVAFPCIRLGKRERGRERIIRIRKERKEGTKREKICFFNGKYSDSLG